MSFNEMDSEGTPGTPPQTGAALPAFDVGVLLQTARKYYWIVLAAIAVAVTAGIVFLKTAEPVYRSSAEIKVERRFAREADADPGEAVSLFENATAEDLKTIEKVFLGSALIDKVIDALQLETRDGFIARGRPASTVTRGDLAAYISERASVTLIPETRLIQVSFESWDPAQAQELARALVGQGIEYYHNQRTEAVNHNIRSLEEETKRLEGNLIASEAKRNNYLREVGSVSVDQELNLVALQLREINSSLSTLTAERLKMESDFEQVAACRGDADKLIAVRSVREMPAVLALSSRAADLRGNLARVQERYGSQHLYKRQAESELKMAEQALREEILKAPNALEAALTIARRNEENLAREQQKLEQKVIQIKSQAAKFQVFQRQVEADRLSYETALKRLNDERAQGRVQPVLIQAVSEAGYGYRASLSPARVLATSFVGGLMLGGALIFLLAQGDRSFRSVEAIEQALGLSVLASVPEVPELNPGRQCPVPVHDARDSAAAEAFRTLTAFLHPDETAGLAQTILIASAEPGEGKSFCALNLAVALAQTGQRTLLVDASLASPSLGRWLLGRGESRGLAEYLMSEASFSNILMASPFPNLDLVTAGLSRAHFVEIFSRGRFREFLEEARVLYDQIVFDSVPVTTASDTLAFARFFPVICLVVQAGKTSKDSVTRAVDLLTRAGARPSGVILSRDIQRAPGRVRPETPEPSGPVVCPACGRRYATREECIRSTTPCTDTTNTANTAARRCGCGAAIPLVLASRRDSSAEGQKRRDIFGELLGMLQEGGIPRDKARSMLLLALKVWRNEIGEDAHRDGSQAGARRRELIEEFLHAVGKSGISREQAEAKLLEAAKSWRNAP